MQIFRSSYQAIAKIKTIVIVNTFITILALVIGLHLSSINIPVINEYKQQLTSQVSAFVALERIAAMLRNGNVVGAILYTFGYNLTSGAFLSTTLTGIIFPLPTMIMALRGVFIGLLFEGVGGTMIYTVVLAGTFILEFGAYILSSSAGVNIGLSLFKPQHFGTKNILQAFILSCKEAGKIYIFVILMLILGAIWEIGGLYYFVK